MRDIFSSLKEARDKWNDLELTTEQYAKVLGDSEPGCKVEIHWNLPDDKIIDVGYMFCVDGQDYDIGDCFIHVPKPDNSGGKDRADPEWIYMIALMANEYCEKIICKP